jgi:hypothetical protein
MAHHYHGKSANFFFNGDFSGKVTIIVDPFGYDTKRIEVDAQDILGLVAEHVRDELIGDIERMSTEELLKRLR